MKTFLKAFFITILLAILIFSSVIAGLYFFGKKGEPVDDKFQVLLLGVDSLDSKNADNTRSDTIMIANVDLNAKKISLMSIPRDTYTKIRGHKSQKLNHSYKYGGPELTLETVNNLLGLNIKKYVVIDYRFVQEVVDAVGGVEIDVPMDMDYDDPTANPPLAIHLKKGKQILNGQQSVGFVRFRKGYKDADLGRVVAQQQFVSELTKKLKSKKIILSAHKLLLSYNNNTKNNIPISQIIKMLPFLMDITTEDMEATTLPGVPNYKDGISYFFADVKKADIILKNMGFK